MNNTAKITLATSIAPVRIDTQKDAINSWRKLGFEVISVNSRIEIDDISKEFPEITFVEADRNACSYAGKPFVYFDDVLAALDRSGSSVCGIVNSDILLITDGEFLNYIGKEATKSFVIGSRMDVASLSELQGEEYFAGFDFFFFDRAFIREYPHSVFCLGLPWWDYWAPIVPLMKGITVKQLITPVAYHVKHSQNWSMQLFNDYSIKFRNHLIENHLYSKIEEDLSSSVEIRTMQQDFSVLSNATLHYIFGRTQKVQYIYPEMGNLEMTRDERLSFEMQREIAFYKRRLRQVERKLVEQHVVHARFQNSLSWKLTEPLRWVKHRMLKRW